MYWGINLKLVVYSALSLFLFSAGWVVNGWRLEKNVSESIQKAQNVNYEIQNSFAKEREKRDAKIRELTILHNNALERLRERPSRSSVSSSNGQVCTGANLSREDAQFLIGEAVRADEVVITLNACYKSYEEARKKIESLHK